MHSFEKAVAYNILNSYKPINFWPLYSISGYGLYIKCTSLKSFLGENAIKKTSFKELTLEEKRNFFCNTKIAVEKNADFYWVLLAYCHDILKCNQDEINLIKNNAVHIELDAGKEEFIRDNNIGIYCTGPLQVFDLLEKKDPESNAILFDLISRGSGLSTHNNFIGLISTLDYLVDNSTIIDDLTKKWFTHLDILLKKIKRVASPDPFQKSANFTVPAMVQYLNNKTKSNITKEQFASIIQEVNNNFYKTRDDASSGLYEFALDDEKQYRHSFELSKLILDEKADLPDSVIHATIKTFRDINLTNTAPKGRQ